MLQQQLLQSQRELKAFQSRAQKLTNEVINLEYEKVVLQEEVDKYKAMLMAGGLIDQEGNFIQPASPQIELPPERNSE